MFKIEDLKDLLMDPEALHVHAKELAASLKADDTLKPWDRSAILLLALCMLGVDSGLSAEAVGTMAQRSIPIAYLALTLEKIVAAQKGGA